MKKKKCKICKKVLSTYNSEDYCFLHHREGQRIKDRLKDGYTAEYKRKRDKAYHDKKRSKKNAKCNN